MSKKLITQKVNCRWCRYRFSVEVEPVKDWRVHAQCVACDAWEYFTVEDTRDPPRPDPKAEQEREAAVQRLGEELWKPINENRGHPVIAWMDRVGNGLFEDDHSEHSWPAPWWVYRFTRRFEAAYIWQVDESWFVRGWHPLRGRKKPPDLIEVTSFKSALDHLG